MKSCESLTRKFLLQNELCLIFANEKRVVCRLFQRKGPQRLLCVLAHGYGVFAHRFTVSIVRRGRVIICRPPAMGQAPVCGQMLARTGFVLSLFPGVRERGTRRLISKYGTGLIEAEIEDPAA